MRDAPTTWEAYCGAEHIAVRFPDGGTSLRALTGVDKSEIPEPRVSVPNFNSISLFVKGTRLLSTEMALMKLSALKDLQMAPLPFESDAVTIYMVWHMRGANDPAQIWLRRKVETIANGIMAQWASRDL